MFCSCDRLRHDTSRISFKFAKVMCLPCFVVSSVLATLFSHPDLTLPNSHNSVMAQYCCQLLNFEDYLKET